jgi:hypothetical protein
LPLISGLVLKILLLENRPYKIIQYADDGIIYEFEGIPEEFLKFPLEKGIKVN